MKLSLFALFSRPPRLSFHTSEYGNFYAKIPAISASLEGDACPILRRILTDRLGCDKIREVSGEGDIWWDFRYQGVSFTCMLLVPSCGGAEFYPSTCTKSSKTERDALRVVVHQIAKYAS